MSRCLSGWPRPWLESEEEKRNSNLTEVEWKGNSCQFLRVIVDRGIQGCTRRLAHVEIPCPQLNGFAVHLYMLHTVLARNFHSLFVIDTHTNKYAMLY
jgi:hypothetical protein